MDLLICEKKKKKVQCGTYRSYIIKTVFAGHFMSEIIVYFTPKTDEKRTGKNVISAWNHFNIIAFSMDGLCRDLNVGQCNHKTESAQNQQARYWVDACC